jgi:hypothetical protein
MIIRVYVAWLGKANFVISVLKPFVFLCFTRIKRYLSLHFHVLLLEGNPKPHVTKLWDAHSLGNYWVTIYPLQLTKYLLIFKFASLASWNLTCRRYHLSRKHATFVQTSSDYMHKLSEILGLKPTHQPSKCKECTHPTPISLTQQIFWFPNMNCAFMNKNLSSHQLTLDCKILKKAKF